MILQLKHAALASALALMVMAVPAAAETKLDRQDCAGPDCADQEDDGSDNRRNMRNRNNNDDDDGTDRKTRNRRSNQASDEARDNDNDDEASDRRKSRRNARSEWRYDRNKHQRRSRRDSRYRHEYDGFWYAEPYWTGPVYVEFDDGISCREGRRIVDRRFNRVRVVECNGRTFTYVGRRDGETFRVSVSSRSGRIVGARPM